MGILAYLQGSYEALRIQIGEARGHNWWCVMFPPLCFVEESEDQLPQEEEEQLDEILTEDQNKLIHYEEESWSVKIKFKLIEWWQELFG
ncbi:MAG: stage II sporulation protein R [Clostridia bacterium]